MDWKILSQIRLRKHFDTVKKAMSQIGKKKKKKNYPRILCQNVMHNIEKSGICFSRKLVLLRSGSMVVVNWIRFGEKRR